MASQWVAKVNQSLDQCHLPLRLRAPFRYAVFEASVRQDARSRRKADRRSLDKMRANSVRGSLIVSPPKASSVVQSDKLVENGSSPNAAGAIPRKIRAPTINRHEPTPADNQKTHTKCVCLNAANGPLVEEEVADGCHEQLRRRVHRRVALAGQHLDARVWQRRRQRFRIRVVR